MKRRKKSGAGARCQCRGHGTTGRRRPRPSCLGSNQRTARASSEYSEAPVRAGWNVRQPASQKQDRHAPRGILVQRTTAASHRSRSRATGSSRRRNRMTMGQIRFHPRSSRAPSAGETRRLFGGRTGQGGPQGRPRQSRARRAATAGDRRSGVPPGQRRSMENRRERAPRPMPRGTAAGRARDHARVHTGRSSSPTRGGDDDHPAPAGRRSRGSEPADDDPETDSRFGSRSSDASDPSGRERSSDRQRFQRSSPPADLARAFAQTGSTYRSTNRSSAPRAPTSRRGGVVTLTSAKTPRQAGPGPIARRVLNRRVDEAVESEHVPHRCQPNGGSSISSFPTWPAKWSRCTTSTPT